MMKRLIGWGGCFFCASGMLASFGAEAALKFEEVYGLVRSNLVGVSEGELSKVAALGLIDQLQGKVALVEAEGSKGSESLVAKTNVFDGAFGYVRVERVAQGLASKVNESLKGKKLKGIVLDLRFARGEDYAAAVDVLNLFVGSEVEALKVGESVLKTAARGEVIEVPLAVLVNRQTIGAAEALAGALKEQQVALLIGSRTAGQALVFDEFPLSNGQRLKIARTKALLGSGKEIGTEGVAPDISLDVDEKNERRWLEDPYLPILKPGTASGPAPFLSSVTNRLGRRMNGAEVARRHREELEEEDGLETPRPAVPAAPVVQDAALARGLDFLKGLSSTRLRMAK